MRTTAIEAAIATLQELGYAGTTIRAIATRGGFNSALIHYYFGSLDGLLIAALDHNNQQRLARYRPALDAALTPADFVAVALRIYRQDVEAGDVTVFSELVGASLANPSLGPLLVERAEPWLQLIGTAVERVLDDSSLRTVLPPREVAYALMAFYLGVNLLTHLGPDRVGTNEVFGLAERLAALVTTAPPLA